MRMRVSKYVLANSLNSNRSTCLIHIHWISDGGLSGHIWLISDLMPKSLRCLVSLNAQSGDTSMMSSTPHVPTGARRLGACIFAHARSFELPTLTTNFKIPVTRYASNF